MKTNNESGVAHLVLILAVAVVVAIGAVGVTVYRKNEAQKASDATKRASTVQQQSSTAAEEKELDSAQAPAAAPAPAPAPTTTPKTSTTTVKSQQRTIQFTKGGGSQQGEYVVVSGTLAETIAGTCTYEFYLNGTLRVGKSNPSAGNKCYMEIPVSDFPKSATYSFKLTFVSSDGTVAATQSPYDIVVQ